MNLDELHTLAETYRNEQAQYAHRIVVCTGTACHSAQGDKIIDALKAEVKQQGLEKRCAISGGGCRGMCAAGPMVSIEPEHTLYQYVTPEHAPALISSLESGPIEALRCDTSVPFFKRQTPVVLEYGGLLNPDSIDAYIALGGFETFLKVLTQMTPNDVIATVQHSGLRGRGGAGYSTGLKWSTVAKAISPQKYVICNGDEGDPGAFMDRSVMEDYPYRLLEGMLIAAYAVGAQGRLFSMYGPKYPSRGSNAPASCHFAMG